MIGESIARGRLIPALDALKTFKIIPFMKKIFTMFVVLLFAVGSFAQAITVAEAIAIGLAQTENNVPTAETYTIEGYVNVITANNFNTNYNNMDFWIADQRGTAGTTALGALQCYHARPNRELQVGDKVRVVTRLKRFYNTVETYSNNVPVTWLESAPDDPEPEIVTGSLRVCAQNLENYYYNYNTGRGNYTPEEFAAKTHKIVNAMLDIDADIYAFCEVEAKPIVLQQLADSMNAYADAVGRYVAVSDNIDEDWTAERDYNIKSGFIYRTDKVATVGSNYGAVGGNGYYAHTMRIQAFRQISDGAKLVISMNHFKAKDSSEDAGEAQRQTNATNLINALSQVATDPDILVLGDLNCQVGETPMTMIINAGYEEQLLKYNAYAWSHCYNGGELIDHVLANESMAEQIVNAYVKHVSAYKCNAAVTSAQSWSDHDPYVVEINLTPSQLGPCEDIEASYLATGGSGLGDMEAVKVSGTYTWRYQSNYGATCQNKGGEGWLLTPTYDMTQKTGITIAFDHTVGYANEANMANEMTLWVTPNYSDVAGSEWNQLTIPVYPTINKNWPDYVHTTVNVPAELVGANTVFGFKYAVAADATNSPTWEVKNLQVSAQCAGDESALETQRETKQAYKIIRHGELIIIRGGVEYTITGQRVY